VIGAEHAHWEGHFYGHVNSLRAILEYAIATNDVQLKAFVRDGYEWTRQPWLVARLGLGGNGQGCAIPRMIGLAIKLSDADIGDYWEDVDLYIRNHGTEMQFTEDIIQASMGAFAMDPFKFTWALCCSPWGAMGLFYAWEGALRYVNGIVRVNLLLNRASPWMDVHSYLPYEGKVVLINKSAREAFVRIPLWVRNTEVSCRINGKTVSQEWFGRYLHIDGLKGDNVVTIEFPMEERVERWTTDETVLPITPGWPGKVTRNYRFKGNTLVQVSPALPTWPLDQGEWWLYRNRASKYQLSKAPESEVKRFATSLCLRW